MTQAYNLSQLANNLNSSGQLDATDGLVNAIPIANGGTGASAASAARTNLEVPSLTGSGASGTWGIDISGNASTVTTITSSQVLNANASASAGEVGTYAMLAFNVGVSTFDFGSNFSGSGLYPASIAYDLTFQSFRISKSSNPVSGTWKFMSFVSSVSSETVIGLFLRIS